MFGLLFVVDPMMLCFGELTIVATRSDPVRKCQ